MTQAHGAPCTAATSSTSVSNWTPANRSLLSQISVVFDETPVFHVITGCVTWWRHLRVNFRLLMRKVFTLEGLGGLALKKKKISLNTIVLWHSVIWCVFFPVWCTNMLTAATVDLFHCKCRVFGAILSQQGLLSKAHFEQSRAQNHLLEEAERCVFFPT